MPTGADDVRSWGQTGSDRPTLKTALLTRTDIEPDRCVSWFFFISHSLQCRNLL